MTRDRVYRVDGVSAPDLAEGEGPVDKLGDNAKVVQAAPEGQPEIAVLGCRDGDDGAVCEDDVELNDVVAAEASLGGKIAEAASMKFERSVFIQESSQGRRTSLWAQWCRPNLSMFG